MTANDKQANAPLSERHEDAMIRQLIRMEQQPGEWERKTFLTGAPPSIMVKRGWIICVRRNRTGIYYMISERGRAQLRYPVTPERPGNDPDLIFDFFTWLRMQHGIILAQWKPDSALNSILVPSDVPVDMLLHEFLNGEE